MATVPPVIPPWAENETQVFDNKLWTLAALFHHLKDTKLIRKSEHYALQDTERVGSSRKLIRAVSVVCLLCSACLSVNNISWAQTQHNSCAACVGRHASTSAAPPPPSSAQSPAVLVEAKQEFSLFLYTSGTPFARADNPHLKRMFQLLGMPDSPTAKQLRTSYLSSTYSRLKKRVEVVVEQLLLDLTAEQQQDVKLVVARLAEVAPDAAAEELDNFEMGAWDPDMTRVANIILRMTKATEIDGRTGTVIAPAHQRLTWWQVYAQSKFPILAKAAMRLLSVHVSTCAAERNWSAWGRTFADAHRNTLSIEKAEELVFIQANDELTNSNQRDQEKELAIELY
ncbi:hypothetical protein QJQ45_007022 [Haematococcus lacustris]|nr:hypothetical protein QJQ45_007022 [Haematococcus lacustris]